MHCYVWSAQMAHIASNMPYIYPNICENTSYLAQPARSKPYSCYPLRWQLARAWCNGIGGRRWFLAERTTRDPRKRRAIP